MHPIRLTYWGLRKHSPMKLDLGPDGQHVLLAGVNGSGKSTLVAAIAFALGADVDVNGLRDGARSEDEPWDAGCSLLFHNPFDAPNRPNAAEYVELGFHATQAPHRAVIREWFIRQGDTPDQLSEQQSFKDYERLEFVKAIRPFGNDVDRFSQVWFQGETTGFTQRTDESKAAFVFEVLGVDGAEREWRAANQAKERAARSLRNAEQALADNLRDVKRAQGDYQQWLSQRQDQYEGMTAFAAALGSLRQRVAEQRGKLEADVAAKEALAAEAEQRAADERDKAAQLQENAASLRAEARTNRAQAAEAEETANAADGRMKEAEGQVQKLGARLTELKQRLSSLPPEAELRQEQERLLAEVAQLIADIASANAHQNEAQARIQALGFQTGALTQRQNGLRDWVETAINRGSELPSRAELEAALTEAQEALTAAQLAEGAASRDLEDAKRVAAEAAQGRATEPLVQQALVVCPDAQQFGRLLEVQPEYAQEVAEQRLAALKYALVSERPVATPQSPIYHIALDAPPAVPPWPGDTAAALVRVRAADATIERALTAWLQRVALVADDAAATAAIADGYLALLPDGTLVDAYGRRGPVSKHWAIGEKAREAERQRAAAAVAAATERLRGQQAERERCEKAAREAAARTAERREIDEGLPAKQAELDKVTGELQTARTEYQAAEVDQQAAANLVSTLAGNKGRVDRRLEDVEQGLAAYAEAAAQEQELALLQQLSDEMEAARIERDTLQRRKREWEEWAEAADTKADAADGNSGIARRAEDQAREQAEGARRALEGLHRQLAADAAHLAEREVEWQRLVDDHATLSCEEFPFAAIVVPEGGDSTVEAAAQQMLNAAGKVRRGDNMQVLSNAPDVFRVLKENYDLKERQLTAARSAYEKELRDELGKRAHLRQAVRTQHGRINAAFRDLLAEVGLRGEIKLIEPTGMDATVEDGSEPEGVVGRYRWQLWAAKGQLPLMLVTPEQGRHGASEVSGGERAKVSLMHALAVIHTLDQRPSFYVFDEFDANLDDGSKRRIIDLFAERLGRKIIAATPLIAAPDYAARFGLAYVLFEGPTGDTKATRVELGEGTVLAAATASA